MGSIARRLEALENISQDSFTGWHGITKEVGQTESEAVSAYECASGALNGAPYFLICIVDTEATQQAGAV